MDISNLSRIQDSSNSDVVLQNLKDEIGLVNNGDMNFLDFLSSNEKELVQLNSEQVNELAALAEDRDVRELLGKAAMSIKGNAGITISSIGVS